jgi:hypothetical protein
MTLTNVAPDSGLRNVVVLVAQGSFFPPTTGSVGDVALLRIANVAMSRRLQGWSDQFLFVFAQNHDAKRAARALVSYGFPDVSVTTLESDSAAVQSELDLEDVSAAIGRAVTHWLDTEHPGAIACVCNDYNGAEFWWSGVERYGESEVWPFSADDFAAVLPSAHRRLAATWLAILNDVVELESIQADCPQALGFDIAAAWAATLCEWLHGFEAASGNGYNHFESEFPDALMPSEFYLGFELARLSGGDLEAACDEAGGDVDDLDRIALRAITEDKRSELREALSTFFGGDTGLFWTLHSSIWPKFDKPMSDHQNDLLGVTHFDDMAEIDAPRQFVTEGWCEHADN